MKNIFVLGFLFLIISMSCDSNKKSTILTESEKATIRKIIQRNIDKGIEATRTKDIEAYMSQLPEDLVIYDESGEIISRDKQKEYALRDWAIIDTTLSIKMEIDSIQFLKKDSILVFTSQRWKRMMFQRDGITTDTVLTTQKHKETWRRTKKDWFGYEIEELGGEIFINGKKYKPE
ncbi:ketosteroid isomerase-like protein [Aquimarina sp. EL_43]|uniref:hypothetical protein n=1 Tax=unclassified Aquimarina TaxID=2627091 RepID=UPI0018C9D8E7|nr:MULTISPECIES: hypothetical protein [unclassified Aquimarina]MBG6129013.1 ketosteroid isomerase-like protein [Aquimarina sp. EL_35]MBG6150077.1 ketosteroid isomerase-like protein [Aquimarina sp. EL_32]MBG6167237.1 ketosteroid isomerase-like protein [Aquimarina sp. EL_43]